MLLRMLAGAGIAAGGGFAFLVAHRQTAATGEFSALGAFGGPAFGVLGLGLLLCKGYREERLERGEDISRLEGLGLLTPRWRAVLGAALLAGLAGFGALSGWW